jgi:predicted Na+-dependent transporter
LGLGIRHWRPQLASNLETPLNRLGNLLLLALFALLMTKTGPLLIALLPANLPAVAVAAFLALVALLLGRAMAGDEPEQRLSAGLVTAMRNPGLALLFANRYGSDMEGLKLMILLYVLVTLVVSAPWIRRQRAELIP